MYEVKLILKNKYGEFIGKSSFLEEEALNQIINMSKTFYEKGGFELTCEDESYIVFAPEIVKESILIIKKKLLDNK
jgi:hypothetical protein